VSERLIPLGEIVATHGIEGWLRVKPYNRRSTTLSSIATVFVDKDNVRSAYLLQTSKTHKGLFLIKLRGIDEIGAAKQCVGAILSVAEEALEPLGPGEYYYYQVLGLDAFDIEGRWIGRIAQIWSKEGGDLYVIRGSEKEYLIPVVKEIIEKIDLPAGRITINPPAGLLDL